MNKTRRKQRTHRPPPSNISEWLLHPISEEEANIILSDEELQADCKRTGVDLGLIVNNMRLTVRQRLEQNMRGLRALLAWEEAARRAGLRI